jgi:hypothetical protein
MIAEVVFLLRVSCMSSTDPFLEELLILTGNMRKN